MRSCAHIRLCIIGDLAHNWTKCTQSSDLCIFRLFCKHNFAEQHHKSQYAVFCIPGMSDITADEFVRCVDVIGPKAVKSSSEKSLTDLITSEQMPELSRLAQVYILAFRHNQC